MTRYERLTDEIATYAIQEDPEASDFDVSHATPDECPQWLSITDGVTGGTRYGQLHETFDEARQRAVAYVCDSISAEYPVCLVDLETGETFDPCWTDLPFVSTGATT